MRAAVQRGRSVLLAVPPILLVVVDVAWGVLLCLVRTGCGRGHDGQRQRGGTDCMGESTNAHVSSFRRPRHHHDAPPAPTPLGTSWPSADLCRSDGSAVVGERNRGSVGVLRLSLVGPKSTSDLQKRVLLHRWPSTVARGSPRPFADFLRTNCGPNRRLPVCQADAGHLH